MGIKPPTSAELDAYATQRDANGIKSPTRAQSPWYDQDAGNTKQLSENQMTDLQVVLSDTSDGHVHIKPGRCRLGNQLGVLAAALEIDLGTLGDDTYFIYATNAAGAATVTHVTQATGWPTTPFWELAEVTITAGAVTSIVDRRRDAVIFWKPQVADVADVAVSTTQNNTDKINEMLTQLRATGIFI